MYRIGIGHDTHRTAPLGPLRLGGIEIAADYHLLGHSDADVLLHAITDALLGAVSAGDIGELFPDTLEENRGKDSAAILRSALKVVRSKGLEIGNVDCIVFAEKPKLSAYKQAIRASIAAILTIPDDVVGVKAKTGEGVGEIGRGEIVSAQSVVLLQGTGDQGSNHGHSCARESTTAE